MRDAGGMKTGNLARAPGEYTTQEARRTRQDAGTLGASAGRVHSAGGQVHETRREGTWRERGAGVARALGERTAQEAERTAQEAERKAQEAERKDG